MTKLNSTFSVLHESYLKLFFPFANIFTRGKMQKICNFMQKIEKKKLIKTAFNKPIISLVTSQLGFEVGLSAARALPCWQVHPDALPWPSRGLPRNAPRHSPGSSASPAGWC